MIFLLFLTLTPDRRYSFRVRLFADDKILELNGKEDNENLQWLIRTFKKTTPPQKISKTTISDQNKVQRLGDLRWNSSCSTYTLFRLI